jgi:hypothetical protein
MLILRQPKLFKSGIVNYKSKGFGICDFELFKN